MSATPRPIESQTVKALSWQLLFGNYRPKLGKERWEQLVRETGAPDFRRMDPDEDCQMEPLNQAVLYIDRVLGRGDGAMIEEVTRASVAAWARIFKNLVQQLQGRPQKMMEIFCTEVHPYFLNDPGASLIVKSAPDRFVLRMDNGLLEGFKLGLVEGFCEIVGAEARIEKRGEEYHVTWEIQKATPAPSKWALFLNATRAPFLTATVVPVLLGTAIAYKDGSLNLGLFFLTLLGAILFHLATNVMNDYHDHTGGADEANFTPTPFGGGSRVIQRGLMEPEKVRNLALGFYAGGIAVGLLLAALAGWQLLLFGVVGILLSYLYTAPPFRLSYRGLGELSVGIGFGPVMVMGAYWIQTRQWSNEAFLASLSVGLLIAAVLYINEFPDRIWDLRAGKRTLLTRLSIPAAVSGYIALIAAAYLIVVAGVILQILPWPTLLALATIPMAWKAVQGLRQNHSYPYRLIPANANTIFAHLYTGLLLFSGYVVAGLFRL